MKFINYLFRSLFLLVVFTGNVMADVEVKIALEKYAWDKRQLIVFTPTAKHPEYLKFLQQIKEFNSDFVERKLHSWQVIAKELVSLNNTKSTELTNQNFRNHFNVDLNEFVLILIGYDQGVKIRMQTFDIDYIFSQIDQMPMRIQEMQNN